MKINNLSFPHPVLGIGDDILPKPSIIANSVTRQAGNYNFKFELEMENGDIQRLIRRGYAAYVCELESPRTLLRKCYFSQQPSFNLKVDPKLIAERITFQFSVVAVKEIKGYINSEWHKDYFGYSFDLEPGDLLAFIGECSYDVDIKYDKLKSVGSFMQITEGKMDKMPRFLLGGDKIEIKLPTELYEKYRGSIRGNKRMSHIIHSSIVFNALVTALLYFEENQNTLWARTLKYRVDTESHLERFKERETLDTGEPEEIMELAQELLMNPYSRLFESLEELINEEEE